VRLDSLSPALAVADSDFERTEAALQGGGLNTESEVFEVNPNPYDFPTLRNGVDLASEVPEESQYIHVVPQFFCESRRKDARKFGVTISSFTSVGGVRCFHTRDAVIRARSAESEVEVALGGSYAWAQSGVDVVFTTVDGSDPEWQRRYRNAVSSDGDADALEKTTNAARYTSHDELRYALRSLHSYAPFVRRIHVVTDNQAPVWLDQSHPQINVVAHAEIIDSAYRPTFNSDAIESFLWRIPGLSERFLYFNDDIMLTGMTSVLDFYTDEGLPKFFPSPRSIPLLDPESASAYTLHAHLMTAAALADHGYPRPVRKFKHAPYACVRQHFEEIEVEFEKELAQTRESRVRSEQSFATISFLYPHIALSKQAAVMSDISYAYIDLAADDWDAKLVDACARRNLALMCVNESDDARPGATARLAEVLSSRFPAVPPWEK
jgi:hypothetical protein